MLMTITDELRNKYSISRIRQKTSYLKRFKKMEVRAARRNERRRLGMMTSLRLSSVMQSMKRREGKVGMRRKIVRRC
jgi:hypothetical protein